MLNFWWHRCGCLRNLHYRPYPRYNYNMLRMPTPIYRIDEPGRAGSRARPLPFFFRWVPHVELRSKGTKSHIRKEILPAAEDIVAVNKEKIKDKTHVIIRQALYNDYWNGREPETNSPRWRGCPVAPSTNRNPLSQLLRARTCRVDTKGTLRLFIGLGRMMHDPKLISSSSAGVQSPIIRLTTCCSRWFFLITVPFVCRKNLKACANQDQMVNLITKAKTKKKRVGPLLVEKYECCQNPPGRRVFLPMNSRTWCWGCEDQNRDVSSGNTETLYKANFWLRNAIRVLKLFTH